MHSKHLINEEPKLACQYYDSYVRSHQHSSPPIVEEYSKISFKIKQPTNTGLRELPTYTVWVIIPHT